MGTNIVYLARSLSGKFAFVPPKHKRSPQPKNSNHSTSSPQCAARNRNPTPGPVFVQGFQGLGFGVELEALNPILVGLVIFNIAIAVILHRLKLIGPCIWGLYLGIL